MRIYISAHFVSTSFKFSVLLTGMVEEMEAFENKNKGRLEKFDFRREDLNA